MRVYGNASNITDSSVIERIVVRYFIPASSERHQQQQQQQPRRRVARSRNRKTRRDWRVSAKSATGNNAAMTQLSRLLRFSAQRHHLGRN